jgi:hypothetical protein
MEQSKEIKGKKVGEGGEGAISPRLMDKETRLTAARSQVMRLEIKV